MMETCSDYDIMIHTFTDFLSNGDIRDETRSMFLGISEERKNWIIHQNNKHIPSIQKRWKSIYGVDLKLRLISPDPVIIDPIMDPSMVNKGNLRKRSLEDEVDSGSNDEQLVKRRKIDIFGDCEQSNDGNVSYINSTDI